MWQCLICDGRTWSRVQCTVRDSKDHGVVHCCNCGHVQLAPVPSRDELAAYYKAETQRKSVHGHMTREEKRAHVCMDTGRRLEVVNHWCAGLKGIQALDIGSGEGFFADEARRQGADVDTVEYMEVFPNRRYDAVCAWHVLEHCVNPITTIQSWFAYLDNGGHLFIEVPNHDDVMIGECPAYASWHYQRAHIHYFTARILLAMANTVHYADLRLFGAQRYSITARNQWHNKGKPMMHKPVGYLADDDCPKESREYARARVKTLTSDTLCLILQK